MVPGTSKTIDFLEKFSSLVWVMKHRKKKSTDKNTQIHIKVLQFQAFRISPPRLGPNITALLDISIYKEKPFAMACGGNSVTIYDITVGATAAVPVPTINLAIIIINKDGASAVKIFPTVKMPIPRSNVVRRPNISPSLPKIGANTAEEVARARVVQVVLL